MSAYAVVPIAAALGVAVAFGQPASTALSQAELEALGQRIRSSDLATRQAAAEVYAQIGPASADAIRERLERMDRQRHVLPANMFKIMDDRMTHRRAHGAHAGESSEEVDLLDVLLHASRARLGTSIEEASEIVALLRALGNAATGPAVRAIIDTSGRFDRIFQTECSRILAQVGDRSMPSLIEARRHSDWHVRKWVQTVIERLGKTSPSDAVQVHDNAVLADILLAFGHIRDPEAMRIILSFANSERVQVREAARQAIAMFGQAAVWALREAYENFTGDQANADWNWDRTLRELWTTYDRYRLAEVYRILDEGLGHAKARRWEKMAEAYDRALARQPMFDRRVEMIPGLFEYGEALLDHGRYADAESVLRKANRLEPSADAAAGAAAMTLSSSTAEPSVSASTPAPAPGPPTKGRRRRAAKTPRELPPSETAATSTPPPSAPVGPSVYQKRVLARVRYLEGLRSVRQGVAEPALFEEALALDPDFSPARGELRRVNARVRAGALRASRVAVAIAIGLTSLATLLLLLGYGPFGKRPRAEPAGASAEPGGVPSAAASLELPSPDAPTTPPDHPSTP